MFNDYLLEFTSAEYNHRLILLDDENLNKSKQYQTAFEQAGFEVVQYQSDLNYRVEYEDKVKKTSSKIVIIANSSDYIPYDILKEFRSYVITIAKLFPKLNAEALKGYTDLDLLSLAYKENFDDLTVFPKTLDFITNVVYSKSNVSYYISKRLNEITNRAYKALSYRDWSEISEDKAEIDLLAAKHQIESDTSELNKVFCEWILQHFGELSSELSRETPILVSRTMEFISDNSDKFVIIVMDGMSIFDWKILSQSFTSIKYEQKSMFAMIPTTTSISRQCLLSNNFPSKLKEPWKQCKEKSEFYDCARELGFDDSQIGYTRSYDAEFSVSVCCGAVIINDVDDMVHAEQQGRIGMFNAMSLYTERGQLADMTRRFIKQGFDVYITADHGNTPCIGLGKLMGTGVELETKSRRMLVLQNFADKEQLLQKYNLLDYPKYYLDKAFDYLICGVGTSFDARGEKVMSHGGISLDEVIIPFITVKEGDNNG